MQSERLAFSRGLVTLLNGDSLLSEWNTDGIHYEIAPQIDPTTKRIPELYTVVYITNLLIQRANDRCKSFAEADIRIVVYGRGYSEELTLKIDAIRCRIEAILEDARINVPDENPLYGTPQPFEIRGFSLDNNFQDIRPDEGGEMWTENYNDFSSTGYYFARG